MPRMTRRVIFRAAHTSWTPDPAPADNTAPAATALLREASGATYTLDVTVAGRIDSATGIIVNIKDIDAVVQDRIVRPFDRQLLNRAVPELRGLPVTPENLIVAIWDRLDRCLPREVRLTRVRLEPAPLEWVAMLRESDREGAPFTMLKTRVYEFAASHRLHSPHLTAEENRDLFGKCNYEHGHGHNYVLEVTVAGALDPRSGALIRDDLLDEIVNREVVDRYDHRHLNHDVPELEGMIPSTEVLTKVIWSRLRDAISTPARLYSVVVRETARNMFEFREEDENL